MLTIYGFCFLAGGIFIFFASVEGFDGVNFDQELEWDVTGSEKIPQPIAPLLHLILKVLPILSLRFWTFGIATFGLSGLLIQGLQFNWSETQVLILSLIIGVVVGSLTASLLHWLKTEGESDSLIRSEDLQGLAGIVSIPFDPDSRGQVCVQVKGSQLYMAANTTEKRSFQKGDSILVVGLENNALWVVSEESIRDL